MAYVVVQQDTKYPSNVFYQALNLTDNVILYWPFAVNGSPVIAQINNITANQSGYTITLPDATLAEIGIECRFQNSDGAHSFHINDNLGTLLYTLVPGNVLVFQLTDNSDAGGIWNILPWAGGYTGVTSFNINSTTLDVTNGSVPTDGNIVDIELPDSIANVEAIFTEGLAVAVSTNPLGWGSVNIVGGNNIIITNGSGVVGGDAANPVIAVDSNLTSLGSIEVGNISLDASTIAAIDTDNDLLLSTTGTGVLDLNTVTVDVNGTMVVPSLQVTGTFLAPSISKAWVNFTYISSIISIASSFNVSSITPVSGNTGFFEIFFTNPMPNINYCPFVTPGTNDSSLPFISHGYYVTRNLSSVVICVVDASGQPLSSILYGVSVQIMSSN